MKYDVYVLSKTRGGVYNLTNWSENLYTNVNEEISQKEVSR